MTVLPSCHHSKLSQYQHCLKVAVIKKLFSGLKSISQVSGGQMSMMLLPNLIVINGPFSFTKTDED